MNVVDGLRLPGLEQALGRVEQALGERHRGGGSLPDRGGRPPGERRGEAAAALRWWSRPPACSGPDGPDVSDDVIQGGVAVELVHLGSLYHDDVMDEAEHRRGVQSVNARWGNLVAILAGDFLLARASEIAASLGTEVAALLARTIGQLCEGEVEPAALRLRPGPARGRLPVRPSPARPPR